MQGDDRGRRDAADRDRGGDAGSGGDGPAGPTAADGEERGLALDEAEPPATLDRARAAVEGALGGRPLGAWAVLAAGGLVLLILLVIVVATTRDGDGDGRPVCVQASADAIAEAVEAGNVERLRVSIPRGEPAVSSVAVDVDLADGTCRTLPQGGEGLEERERVVGLAYLFNQAGGDQRRIAIDVSQIDVPEDAVGSEPTLPPTVVPTAPPVVPPPAPPVPTEASPAASPVGADVPAGDGASPPG